MFRFPVLPDVADRCISSRLDDRKLLIVDQRQTSYFLGDFISVQPILDFRTHGILHNTINCIKQFFVLRLFNFLLFTIFILILDRCLSVFCLNFKLLSIDQLQFSHVIRYITNKLSIFIQKIISSLFFLDFNSLIAFTFILQVLLFFFHLLDDLISDLLIGSFDGCRGCRLLFGNGFLI